MGASAEKAPQNTHKVIRDYGMDDVVNIFWIFLVGSRAYQSPYKKIKISNKTMDHSYFYLCIFYISFIMIIKINNNFFFYF